MSENVKNLSECKKEIDLEISSAEVMKEWDRVVTQYASRAKIKGFRPGKAPKDMIKRMYYPDIKKTLINNLVPQALNKELTEKKITPVGQPVISDLHFIENEPLRFKVSVEISSRELYKLVKKILAFSIVSFETFLCSCTISFLI